MSGWCQAASARWPTVLITIKVPFQPWVLKVRLIQPPSSRQCGNSRRSLCTTSSSACAISCFGSAMSPPAAELHGHAFISAAEVYLICPSTQRRAGEPRERCMVEGTHVVISAAARLHLGFLDLHGGLGRRFGSIGLAISGPRTKITIRAATRAQVTGPERDRVR